MEMKSRAVKLFCAIAESGSLLAASNKLNFFGRQPNALSAGESSWRQVI